MPLPEKPGFDCPNCESSHWRWAEISQWGGWECDDCGDVLCYLRKI